jgi:predicted metal-dependent phosphoesterase TrpH
MMHVKADLHVHSNYSADSIISPKELVRYARKSGLNAVAITDHDQVEGARKIAKETDFLVIPGTEVSSLHGHIVGLNVQGVIPRGLPAIDTVEKIHQAGGIAIACHPFTLFKGSVGKHTNKDFDAVETKNASALPFGNASRKAEKLADQLGLPRVGGTDAHIGQAIGYAYTVIEAEQNVEDVVKAIAAGNCQPFGGPIPISVRMQNTLRFLSLYIKR